MSKGLLNLKVIDADMINQDEIKCMVDLMQSYGYDVIVTPNNLNIDMIDEDVEVASYDNYPIKASDIIKVFNDNIRHDVQRYAEYADDEENDMPEFNRIQDGIIKIQAYIDELNEKIQAKFPDNDELYTKVLLNDDYIDTFMKSDSISYAIDSNNPEFLAFVNEILEENKDDEDNTQLLNLLYSRITSEE